MDNSGLLVQAASGLQKNLAGYTGTVLKESLVSQISAAIYYQAQVVSKLTTTKSFQNSFRKTIFTQIEKDFGLYVDAKARTAPETLHHVYEWKRSGDPSARLFDLKIKSADGLSFSIGSSFRLSKTAVPSNFGSRHVFKNKAVVMEAGKPVVISPVKAERLVFEIRGSTVFMPKGESVTVRKPGGGKATGRYQIAHAQFFTGQLVNLSIKKSGFQRLFNQKMTTALSLPADIKRVKYSFSPNTINMQAKSAIEAAFGGMS